MTDGTFIYWIEPFVDETVPCDCSLEGWAEWLSAPDEDWGRPAAAKDGDTFKAQSASRTEHTVTLSAGEMTFSPPLAEGWTFLALCNSEGGGWYSESIAGDIGGFQELVEDAADSDPDSGPVAAVKLGPEVMLIFRQDGDRHWIEISEIVQ